MKNTPPLFFSSTEFLLPQHDLASINQSINQTDVGGEGGREAKEHQVFKKMQGIQDCSMVGSEAEDRQGLDDMDI